MKIGLISSMNPFGQGGYRFIVEWAREKIAESGHETEVLYLPISDDPAALLRQMIAFQSMRLEHYYDRIVTFRPPAHVIRHPRKTIWFIHHVRIFYDLWQHEYCPVPNSAAGIALRDQVRAMDTIALREAEHVFANSRTVARRLDAFNGVKAEVLYPPILNPDRFTSRAFSDEILCICRMEPHKRQDLLIEAIAASHTRARLRLCGPSATPDYVRRLKQLAKRLSVADRVVIDDRWVSESEKEELLGGSLAAAYVPYDEDSYGYPVLEAAHAGRCTISTTDAGGVGEFIVDGWNGDLVAPRPDAVAMAIDRLFEEHGRARMLGDNARARIAELRIGWEHVLARLLS